MARMLHTTSIEHLADPLLHNIVKHYLSVILFEYFDENKRIRPYQESEELVDEDERRRLRTKGPRAHGS